jgi:pimeloyl-ACP methyl ester carboxylesterase
VRELARLSRKDPHRGAGAILDAIRVHQEQIAGGNEDLIESYNYLVSRFVDGLESSGIEPWDRPVTIEGKSTSYVLSGVGPSGFDTKSRRLVPADMLRYSGEYARERVLKPGVGAPVVAELPFAVDPKSTGPRKPFSKRYGNATAVVRVAGDKATLELLDPFSVESVSFAGRTRPLAADYGAPVCQAVGRDRVDKLGLARLLNPEEYAQTTYLARLQPYDPRRIPVLLVHGLQDSPATWLPMYLELMKDSEIRKNFQFWVFSYPSGYPYPYSASLLRKELARMRRDYPGHKDMVLVGHSMGGVINRLMVMDAGDRIWVETFGKPPSETRLGGRTRRVMEEVYVFERQPKIGRVIFLSSPHGGSELASNWLGRTASRLVRPPAFIADVVDSARHLVTLDSAGAHLGNVPNSIDTLSPRDRFVRAAKKIPIHPGIPYHSIVGDRGKGDTPDSSDGVVAYWSSHLEGAVSERIVPSHHSSHQSPEGIDEVRRILLEHLK